MTFAVVRILRGEPRFFTGLYDQHQTCFSPVTTGRPDQARAYESRDIAQVIADFFDALDGVKTGKPQRQWLTIELPEAWT